MLPLGERDASVVRTRQKSSAIIAALDKICGLTKNGVQMRMLRTPDERFQGLADFPYQPNYLQVDDGDGGTLRIHYVET